MLSLGLIIAIGAQALRRACHPHRLRPAAGDAALGRGAAVAQAAAFTLLNPHLYLDTVLLVGSIGAQQPGSMRGWFIAGASAASAPWFGLLGCWTGSSAWSWACWPPCWPVAPSRAFERARRSRRSAGRYTGAPMSARVLAFLLAMLMLWSGLAVTEQRFAEALELPVQTAGLSEDAKRGDLNGSMDDHVVDDQPAQPFGEPALDIAALIDSAGQAIGCSPASATCPLQPADTRWAAPLLEGLQRPPKNA